MANRSPKATRHWTNLNLLNWSAEYLKARQIDSPRTTAEILLSHVLGRPRIELYVNHDKPLETDELAAFKVLLKRRVNREPVAYITGSKSFWTLDLMVSPDVLIPRPETECLVEAVLEHIQAARRLRTGPLRILDLGTGTGAVVLSLASEHPGQSYFASDISLPAIRTASANAVKSGITGGVAFFISDWFRSISAAGPPLDIIVSNPPYIRNADLEKLQPEIRRFEPRVALDGGGNGLNCLATIIENAHHYLIPGGRLLMEIGADQKKGVQAIIDQTDRYTDVVFTKDYSGHDRVVQVKKK